MNVNKYIYEVKELKIEHEILKRELHRMLKTLSSFNKSKLKEPVIKETERFRNFTGENNPTRINVLYKILERLKEIEGKVKNNGTKQENEVPSPDSVSNRYPKAHVNIFKKLIGNNWEQYTNNNIKQKLNNYVKTSPKQKANGFKNLNERRGNVLKNLIDTSTINWRQLYITLYKYLISDKNENSHIVNTKRHMMAHMWPIIKEKYNADIKNIMNKSNVKNLERILKT
jgi:hypothetical protein